MQNGRRVTSGNLLAFLGAVLTAAGCASTGAPPPAQIATDAPSATLAGTSDPSPPEPLPSEIAYAIHQREQFGLRSDLAWVLAVAADPRARIELLDFPMLPEEEAAFSARQAGYDEVASAVKAYASSVIDEFGGVYIDQQRHTVVALWTAQPGVHWLRVRERLGAAGPLEVRQVRYSERALRALQDRIAADWDWIESLEARPVSVGVDVIANVVIMSISSVNPDAPAQILSHYGVPPDMLRVDSDGTGVRLLAWGWVEGTVITAEGAPPGTNTLNLSWKSDGSGECGVLDMGFGVADDGSFRLPCTQGGWTIIVQALVLDVGWVNVGQAHVIVPPNGTGMVMITLEPGAKLSG